MLKMARLFIFLQEKFLKPVIIYTRIIRISGKEAQDDGGLKKVSKKLASNHSHQHLALKNDDRTPSPTENKHFFFTIQSFE